MKYKCIHYFKEYPLTLYLKAIESYRVQHLCTSVGIYRLNLN